MYSERRACRCCEGRDLVEYLNLNDQPLANAYHHGTCPLPFYPLRVMLCRGCGLSQLSVVVEPAAMFGHYHYVSGTTETFRTHCSELAVFATRQVASPTPHVLDIAANDGTLLESFRALGCDVVGVEPARNLRAITEAKGLPVVVDYWSETAADNCGRPFDIITATNVAAHVDDLTAFLSLCRSSLREGGIIVLEVPYCARMISQCEFDTIYHEHLSYFLVGPLQRIMARVGLCIEACHEIPIHGGSLRLVLKDGRDHCDTAHVMCEREAAAGLRELETYRAFGRRAGINAQRFGEMVTSARMDGRRVVGYGASAKGNTALNFAGVDLDYIADDNPLKWDCLTPGRSIPIVRPTRLSDESSPVTVVTLAWNFLDETLRRVTALRPGADDLFLGYVPEVRLFSASGTSR